MRAAIALQSSDRIILCRSDSETAVEVGRSLGITRVTNRRWATSAYGTASACALTPRDTVYMTLPLYHSTGMFAGWSHCTKADSRTGTR